MQSTSCEMLGWVKYKLESRLPGEISITSDMPEKAMAPHSSTLAWKIPWTEVRDIVQEAVIKTIPKKKKCRKAKWLSEEALQIAEKRS